MNAVIRRGEIATAILRGKVSRCVHGHFSSLVVLGLALGVFAPPASASVYTWSSVGTNWSAASNWGGTAPGSADVGLFNLNATYTDEPSLTAPAALGAVWVTGSGAVTISGTSVLSIAGTTVSFNPATGIEMDPGAGSLTIGVPIALTAAQFWRNNSSSPLTISGSIACGSNLLTLAGAGSTYISGVITGTGGLTTNSGSLFVTASGALNSAGNVTVSGGTMQTGAWTLGNGQILNIASGATFTSTGSVLIPSGVANPYSTYVTGSGIWQLGASGSSIANPDINAPNSGDRYGLQITPTINTGTASATHYIEGLDQGCNPAVNGLSGDLVFSGSLTGAGNLYFYGTPQFGTPMAFMLNANNSAFTGGVTLEKGELYLNNPSALTAANGVLLNPAAGELATLRVWNDSSTIGALASLGSGTAQVIGRGLETLTINQSTNTTFSGVVTQDGGGVLAIVKAGSGMLTLSGSSNYTGSTTLSGGTLNVGSPQNGTGGALGLSGTINFSGGLLQYSASNQYDYSSRFAKTANQQYNVDTNGQTVTWASALTSSGGSLTKFGGGTLILSASNAYSGPTTIGGGTLVLSGTGSINSSSAVSVNGSSAALLQIGSAASTPAITVTQGTLDGTGTVGNVTVADLSSNVVAAGNGGTGTLSTGNLTLNGAATVNLPSGSTINAQTLALNGSTSGSITVNTGITRWNEWTVGGNKLIGYTSYNGANLADLTAGTIGGLSPRQMVTGFTNNTSAQEIDLTIGGDSTFWTGADGTSPTQWTTNTAVFNWQLALAGTATYYLDGDTALFDDRATGSATVNIAGGNVNPWNVTFKNAAKSYTLESTGGYGIAGPATLSIDGTGSVTIANSNTYTGGTAVNAGVLNLVSTAAVGTGMLSVYGGTLNANAIGSVGAVAVSVSGGVFNANYAQSPASVTLSSGTVNANAVGALGSGPLVQTGGVLTASFAQSLSSVALSGGLLNLNAPGALGSGSLTITGGSLDNSSGSAVTLSANNAQSWNGDFAFNGTNNLNLGTGVVTLGSSRTVTVSAGTLIVGGTVLSTTYALTKAGLGSLAFSASGALNAIGNITVSGGTLQSAGWTSSNTQILNIASGATFVSTGSVLIPAGKNTPYSTYVTGSGAWQLGASGSSLASPDINAPYNNIDDYGVQVTAAINTGSSSATRYIEGTDQGANPAVNGLLGDLVLSGSLSGAGNLYFFGTPQSGTPMAFMLNANNSAFTGAVTLEKGELYLNNANALTAANMVLLNPGSGELATLRVWNNSMKIGGLSSLGSGTAQVIGRGVETLTINQSTNTTFSGAVTQDGGGVLSIVKTGTGSLTFAGSNSYTGSTTISAGTLSTGSLAPSALVLGDAFGDSGTLNYTGNSVAFTHGITVSSGGGQINAATAGQTLTISSTANITGSGALAFGGAGNTAVASSIQNGITSLTVAGNIALSSSNGYAGATNVAGGTMTLSGTGSINSSSAININGSTAKFLQTGSVASTPAIALTQGTLDGTGTVGNVTVADSSSNVVAAGNGSAGTLTTGNLTFNGAATVNLPSGSIINAQALLFSNSGKTITVDASRLPWIGGTNKLIGYTSFNGANLADLLAGTIGGLTPRQSVASPAFTYNAVSDEVDLNINSYSPYWTGTASSQWTTSSSVLNWQLEPGNTATFYIEGDRSIFDDSATGTTVVDISSGNVNPTTVTFGNLTKSYTLQSNDGFGISGSATLAFVGSGTVTITNSNTYTGGTAVNAGVLNLGGASDVGTGTLYVNGGTLNAKAVGSLGTVAVSVSGGVFNANYAQSPSSVMLSGGTTNANAVGALGSVALVETGGVLTISFSQSVSSVTLSGGLLNLNAPGALGSGSLTITGGSLDNSSGSAVTLSTNNSQYWNGDFTFNGTNNLNLGTGVVTLGSSRTVTVSAGTLIVGGTVLSTTYGLTKAGPGTLAFSASGALNAIGNVTVSGGTLQSAGWTSSNTQILNIASGATFVSTGSVLIPAGKNTPYSTYVTGSGAWQLGASGSSLGSPDINAPYNNIDDYGAQVTAAINTGSPGSTHYIEGTDQGCNPAVNGLSGDLVLSGSMSGAGNLYFFGTPEFGDPMAFMLNGNNSAFTGGVTLEKGELYLNSPNALTAANMVLLNPGSGEIATLRVWNNSVTIGALASLGSGTAQVIGRGIETLTITQSTNTTYSGAVTQDGGGVLSIVKAGSGILTFAGSNSYTGSTTLSGGMLNVGSQDNGAGGPLGMSGSINFSGGVLQYSASNQYDYSSRFAKTAGQQYDVDSNSQTVTWATALSSSGGMLAKYGAGSLILSASNSFSGATTVGGGTLMLAGTGSINSSSAININGSTAKFLQTGSVASTPAIALTQGTLDGTGTVGSVTVADLAGNVVAAGNGSAGTLTTGNLTFNGAATVNLPSGAIINAQALSFSTSGKTITVDTSRALWLAGATKLIGYSSFGGANFADLTAGTIGGLSPRQTVASPAFTNNAVTDEIDLNIISNTTHWTGTDSTSPTQWSTNTSVLNWQLQPVNSATFYIEGDKSIFDDSATGSTLVDISSGNVNPATVTFNNSVLSYTLTSSGGYGISGSASLAVTGTGSVTIANSNTYNGGTAVNAGVLNLNSAAAVGTGTMSVYGGTLNANAAGSLGTVAVSVSGGVFNANYAQSPASVTLSSGTINANAVGALGSGPLVQTGGVLTAGFAQSVSSVALGGGLLNLNAPGALGSGSFTITGGSLDNSSGSAIALSTNNAQFWNGDFTFNGTNNLNLGAGPVTLGSSRTVTVSAGTLAVGGTISGGYSLTKSGNGILLLSSGNNYTGGTSISAGTLQYGIANSLPTSGAVNVNGSSAVLDLGGFSSSAGSVALIAGTIQDGTLTGASYSVQSGLISATLAGSGALNQSTGGLVTLSGSNTYSGATTIGAGTLQIAGGGVLGGGNYVHSISDSGTLLLSTSSNQTLGGAISGPGSLTINGVGALTLSASNGYSGGTSLNAGTLVISNGTNGSATGTGLLTLNGGILASDPVLGGTISGAVMAGSGMNAIAPGGIDVIGTLKLGSSLTLNKNATLDFDINSTTSDRLALGGALLFSGTGMATVNLSITSSPSGSYTLATFAADPGVSLSDFMLSGNSLPSYTLQLTETSLQYAPLGLSGPSYWTNPVSDSWTVASKWTGPVPNAAGAQAILSGSLTASATVSLDNPQTIGELTLGNSSSGANGALGYLITAGSGGSLTLDNTGSIAEVFVTGGNHEISANVALAGSLSITPTAGTSLDISGNITENASGMPLLMNGPGQLSLDGSNSFTGGTTVTNGTLILDGAASLLAGSSLTIGTAVAPGAVFTPPSPARSTPAASPDLAAVPEPGTFALLAVCGLLLVAYRKRFRNVSTRG